MNITKQTRTYQDEERIAIIRYEWIDEDWVFIDCFFNGLQGIYDFEDWQFLGNLAIKIDSILTELNKKPEILTEKERTSF